MCKVVWLDVNRQTKLDEALLSSGRISDALQALMDWLSKAQSYLTEDQPTLGDLDTVTMLLEQHKVLCSVHLSRSLVAEIFVVAINADVTNVQFWKSDVRHFWHVPIYHRLAAFLKFQAYLVFSYIKWGLSILVNKKLFT